MHEFGHFITAKLSHVRVNEFAIGMGPAIFKKKFGETVYSLRILPFGGYCAMEGEDAESDDPRAFSSRPVFARILIVVAGSLMNLITGIIVLSLVFAPVKEWNTPTIEHIDAVTEFSGASLMPGDTIVAVDGYRVYMYADISMGMMRGASDGKYDIDVLRNGEKVSLSGLEFASGDTGKGHPITFKREKANFLTKTKFVAQNAYNLVRLVKLGLSDLVSGAVSRDDLSGPVGIGKIMVDTAKTSMSSLWYLLAFISINLGIMNLLPIPALDGGRLVFLLIELVRGKPVPPKYEGYIHAAGLAFLMLLMLFVTYNDIVKIFVK